jgi:hypothetical protein
MPTAYYSLCYFIFLDSDIKIASKGLHQLGLLMPSFHTIQEVLKSNGKSAYIHDVITDINKAVLEAVCNILF